MGCISRALPCEDRKGSHGVLRLARETLTAAWQLYVWCSPDTQNRSLLVFGERRHSTGCEASTSLQCASRECRGSDWQQKLTEICIQLTWHSPSPTPLLPALTLSAGEYRV